MRRTTNLVVIALVLMAAACGTEALEVGNEPKPEPSSTGEPRSEQLKGGKLRTWPASEDVDNEGTYFFTVPHCGLDWMVDFDTSFWKAIEPDDFGNGDKYPFFYNSDEGTISFKGADSAVYTASTGDEIRLKRLPGPITIHPCM
jgi:hypothetical protein